MPPDPSDPQRRGRGHGQVAPPQDEEAHHGVGGVAHDHHLLVSAVTKSKWNI